MSKAKAGKIGGENAPDIKKNPVALAAKQEPIDVVFGEIDRWNLLPVLGSGIHPVSTSGAGLLCGLHALVYSYNAARDLAAPEGIPVPLADSVTAQELITFRRSRGFWQEALEYLTAGGQLTLEDESGVAYSEEQMLVQVKEFIPDVRENYTIADLQCLLGFLNKRYETHYTIGDVTQGFNVRWDAQKKEWDLAYKVPTQSMDGGRGIRPVLWLYNDNYEREHESFHQKGPRRKEGIGHWMGFSTLHREIDEDLIDQANSWFGDGELDAYLEEGVWIVTEDSQGYQAELEDHQDPRELEIFKGCFVREPAIAQKDVAPQGYKWVQAGPYANGVPNPGMIGIIPLRKLKQIHRNALRDAHDISGANAANILKKSAVKRDEKGLWIDFVIYRSIEATSKIGRKYAGPKDPAKKFVKGFTFEDNEFLLDTHEPLHSLYPRMIRIDGTSGRVKPRNTQFLERAWGLPGELPVADKSDKRKPEAVIIPGMKAISGIKDKTDVRYRYEKGMNAEDFKIMDLRLHCQARGLAFQDYGRSKVTMLAALVNYDSSEVTMSKAMDIKVVEPVDGSGLPMRRVLADVPKYAGPPKIPPFFATEIVLEIGKGNADDPATWVTDYEGRVGRIDDNNLEPIKGAWAIELDMLRWNRIIGDMRKDIGWRGKSKVQNAKSKVPAPKAKAATPKAKSATPKAATPKVATQKRVTRSASSSKAATPEAASPKAATRKAATRKAASPKAAAPKPSSPKGDNKKRPASESSGSPAKKAKTSAEVTAARGRALSTVQEEEDEEDEEDEDEDEMEN